MVPVDCSPVVNGRSLVSQAQASRRPAPAGEPHAAYATHATHAGWYSKFLFYLSFDAIVNSLVICDAISISTKRTEMPFGLDHQECFYEYPVLVGKGLFLSSFANCVTESVLKFVQTKPSHTIPA